MTEHIKPEYNFETAEMRQLVDTMKGPEVSHYPGTSPNKADDETARYWGSAVEVVSNNTPSEKLGEFATMIGLERQTTIV